MNKLEWYVLIHNFNEGRIDYYNIFSNAKMMDEKFGIPKLLKSYTTYNNFKEELGKLFRYAYHSKVEYELLVSGVPKGEQYKLDIWYQIKPNLDLIAKYIIEEYNKHKRKKIVV